MSRENADIIGMMSVTHTNKTFTKIIILLIIFHSLSVTGILYVFGNQDRFPGLIGAENEEEYFNVSRAIIKGRPINTIRTIGLPLFFIPFIHLFKAVEMKQILFPVSFFNSFILYNISIILVAIIALRLTNNFNVSTLTVGLWTISPWLVYLFVKVKPAYDYLDLSLSRLICQMFMPISSDGISTFFVLLTVYLFIVFLNNKKPLCSIILGLNFAISILIRPQNIALLGVILFIYIIRKEVKKIFVFIISVLSALILQFIYNWFASGSLLNLKTITEFENMTALDIGYTLPFYSIRSIPYNLIYIYREFPLYALIIMGLISIILITVFIDLYRKARLLFYILFSWISSYLVVYGLHYSASTSLLRFMMPIIPAILIVISLGAFRIIDILYQKAKI